MIIDAIFSAILKTTQQIRQNVTITKKPRSTSPRTQNNSMRSQAKNFNAFRTSLPRALSSGRLTYSSFPPHPQLKTAVAQRLYLRTHLGCAWLRTVGTAEGGSRPQVRRGAVLREQPGQGRVLRVAARRHHRRLQGLHLPTAHTRRW